MANQLTITFTAASPAPSGGYLVRYWPTSNPANIQTTTVASSPAVITGLTATSYTGTIESICSFGNSTRIDFQDQVCPAIIMCGVFESDKSIFSYSQFIFIQIGKIGLVSFLIFSSFANLLSILGISTQINFVQSTGASILSPFSTSSA
jgi:hypothetical protein